ncbi:unnamed protein product [Clavelina lepadiformis]|uniref:Mitochondrial import inner membrane translocase subunit Tim23 n=1 Tax=Clavelina lepadiformis TaxID=159417 RepID=A0ABP0G386_CLALP
MSSEPYQRQESDGSSHGLIQTPYLNINPHYLQSTEEYILPEDASPIRSRAQMMFSMIGTATVFGAALGGIESIRYSGLQLLKGKSERMQTTSAVLKNGGRIAQKCGSIALLYCACSIICEKCRGGEDDEINTLVGGAAAGALYSLPGVLNVKKHSQISEDVETLGVIRRSIRRLPPVGRFFFGTGVGLAVGGLLCLYKTQASDYVRQITRKS